MEPDDVPLAEAAGAPAQPARARIAGNITFLSLAEAFARLLTLITSVVVARELGPTLLGQVALAQTLAVFVASMADGGLTLLTYRQIVTRPHRLSRLVADTALVQVGLSVVMMAALVGIALVAPFGSGLRELLIVFAPYALCQALNVVYAVQALERMGSVALIKAATQLLTAIPTVALVVATHDPIWVAVGLIFGQLVGDAITFVVLRRRDGFRFLVPHLSAAEPLLKGGLPLLGSLLLFTYMGSLDIPVLSAFRPSREVGEYSAAARFVYTAGVASQVVLTAVLPELVRRHTQGPERFAAFANTLVALTARVTLAGMAIVVVESGAIVNILYGDQYDAASAVLAILAPVVPLIWYAHLLGFMQVAAGRQRDFFVCLAISSLAATVAFPVGAALWGAKGLSIGATVASAMQAAVFALYARRRLGISAMLPALRQLPYGLIPIALILVLHGVAGPHSLLAAIPLWVAGLTAAEAAARWPTVGFLVEIRRARRADG